MARPMTDDSNEQRKNPSYVIEQILVPGGVSLDTKGEGKLAGRHTSFFMHSSRRAVNEILLCV